MNTQAKVVVLVLIVTLVSQGLCQPRHRETCGGRFCSEDEADCYWSCRHECYGDGACAYEAEYGKHVCECYD